MAPPEIIHGIETDRPPAAPSPVDRFDLVLAGGGLQNALITLAVTAAHPRARIAVVERAETLGGNHTWCFHAGDVSARAASWIEPLVVHRWPGYRVAFPRFTRTLPTGYAAITSTRLDEVVRALPTVTVVRGEIAEVAPRRVVLRDGAVIEGRLVVDARGPDRAEVVGGYQKFVGVELVTDAPHGLTTPMLMDATVPQLDGFRFLYVLPLAADRLLVEDTYFSDGGFLDVDAVRSEAIAYAAAQGWRGSVARTETGVLPLPWQAEVALPSPGLVVGGYQGGWFHPVTGYSLPVAARLAEAIADGFEDDELTTRARAAAATQADQLIFACRLVWMMFRWFPPAQRRGVLEHFYRLPEDTVARFYALAMTRRDRARFFLRTPPRGLSWRAVMTGGVS